MTKEKTHPKVRRLCGKELGKKPGPQCSAENPVVGHGGMLLPKGNVSMWQRILETFKQQHCEQGEVRERWLDMETLEAGDQQRRKYGQDHEKDDKTGRQGLGDIPSELLGVAAEGVQEHSIHAAPPVQAQIGPFNKEFLRQSYEFNF